MNAYYREDTTTAEMLVYVKQLSDGYFLDTGYNPIAGELTALMIFYNGFLFADYKTGLPEVCTTTDDLDIVIQDYTIMECYQNAKASNKFGSFGYIYEKALLMVEQTNKDSSNVIAQIKKMISDFGTSLLPMLQDEKIMNVVNALGNADAITAQNFGDAVYASFKKDKVSSKKERRASKKED